MIPFRYHIFINRLETGTNVETYFGGGGGCFKSIFYRVYILFNNFQKTNYVYNYINTVYLFQLTPEILHGKYLNL